VGIDKDTKDHVDQGFYPELKAVPLIGAWDQPNYEKIAMAKPDVVIMLSSYPPLPDEVAAKLEPFGIAVVGLDFYRVEDYFREVRTLGLMLGLEEKADAYLQFFKKWFNRVSEKVEKIPQDERKKVYFEGSKKYQTYGGAGYGCGIPGLIRAAGGIDLYPEMTAVAFQADPEDVAVRNPDLIFKGNGEGYYQKDNQLYQSIHAELRNRPELAATSAMKNNQVYVLSWDVAGGARKKFGPVFLAKLLYPERFRNLDPVGFLKEYLENYQGRPFQGLYLYPDGGGVK
jgi:iron complex transport system substrate-binding protein